MATKNIEEFGIVPYAAPEGFEFIPSGKFIIEDARSRDKVARAIQREVRRLKFTLYVEIAGLYFSKICLQMRALVMRIFCQ